MEHRLVRHPKNFKGKVQGGCVVGCTCGVLTFTSDILKGIYWHAQHVKDAAAAVTE